MRITNLEKGEDYTLSPSTKIEIERTNPFFNPYGEQSTPLDLPGSERNRRLLDFPDMFGRKSKMTAVDVAIHDGEYFAQCRQVVLASRYKGSISTAFYINDGSFFSRIQNVRLKDIFKDEFVPGVNSVPEAIRFCRSLRDDKNDKFTIFPLLVEDDSGVDSGFNFKLLNAFGKITRLHERHVWVWKDNEYQSVKYPEVEVFNPDMSAPRTDFYNAVQRTEYVDRIPITLAPGYYITPFIRANYLLKRIFEYFGYELRPNFFTQTEPFSKMVVLNKVIDTIVNGRIKVADLVPDVTCAEFLAVFRKKFCCEFTSDEGRRTADVIFLRQALADTPAEDLTSCVTSEPTISYKAATDYKRLTLSSEQKVDSTAADSYDDLASMVSANPAAYFNPVDGAFYKEGFSGDYKVVTKIGESSQDYNVGGELETTEVKIQDLMPEFRQLTHTTNVDDTTVTTDFEQYLFVGSYVTLNSKMVVAAKDGESASEAAAKQPVMLAFSYLSDSRPEGTISAYDIHSVAQGRIFDYALYYNGEYGIFERFYRDYDNLLRNSLHDMKVRLLLSQSQKQNIPAHAKMIIRGVPFFFNKLKFTLGGRNEPVESELRTITIMQPADFAPKISELLPAMTAGYKWVGKFRQTKVSESDYDNSGLDKDRTFNTIYPPLPSKEYAVETYGLYAFQSSFTSRKVRKASFWHHSKWEYTRTDVWLECVRA